MAYTKDQKVAAMAKASGIAQRCGDAKTWGDALSWFTKKGATEITDGDLSLVLKSVDVSGFKMVQITLGVDEATGAAEVLSVEPMDAPIEGEAVGDDADPEKDDEEDTKNKSVRLVRGMEAKAHIESQNKGSRNASPETKALIAREKRYTKAVDSGGQITVPGFGRVDPLYSSGELASRAGAWARLKGASELKSMRGGYPAMAHDMEVLGISTKTGTTTNALLGGNTVPDEFNAELIENRNTFGAARLAAGARVQNQNQQNWPKRTGDVTVTIQETEGAADTATDMTFGLVGVTLHTFVGTSVQSRQLWDDSAINMGETFGRSYNLAQTEKEDRAFFLGTAANGGGVNDLITGTNGADTYDANATTTTETWGTSWTIEALQAAQGQLPEWARTQAVWVVSAGFFDSRMQTLQLNAGGNTGDNIATGFKGLPRFSGLPVIFSSILPVAYSVNQIVGYVGAFPLTSIFAEKPSASEISFDESRYHEQYAVSMRGVTRAWFTHHDIGSATASTSGVVALKD